MKMPSLATRTLPPLIALVGPTAVGKTELSIRLGEALDAEIVSADSRQVYRGMDIGTAKATARERARLPHHLLDIVDPDQSLSLARFQELAMAAIEGIHARGRVPFLVGGTGQYVMAVVEGWRVPRVPPDQELRKELYLVAEQDGQEALHRRLEQVDPVAAGRIDPRNVRRVVRALEVCLVTGRPISELQGKSPPPFRTFLLGLSAPRELLYKRIDQRIDRMLAAGLEAEVRGLVDKGYGFDLPSLSGVGYVQFAAYFRGETSLEEAVSEIRRATRRLVRQQSNWFRSNDPRIQWFDATSEPFPAALAALRSFLSAV